MSIIACLLSCQMGLITEEAFKESLRKLLEKKFGFKVRRWKEYEERGKVFKCLIEVELDFIIIRWKDYINRIRALCKKIRYTPV